jgi:hypothetical protein
MSEPLTEDRLAALFAELRAGEVAAVRAPGAGAARQAVRRRRATASVVAGVAMVVVTAGTIAVVSHRPPPGEPAAVGPVFGEEGLRAVARRAEARLPVPDHEADTPLSLAAAVEDASFSSDAGPAVPGSYVVHAACVGSGAVTVSIRFTPGTASRPDFSNARELTSWRVTCDDQPTTPPSHRLATASPGTLTAVLTPNAVAVGRAGFALHAARVNSAREMEPVRRAVAPNGTQRAMSVGWAHGRQGAAWVREIGAGTHRLVVACADRGSVEVTVHARTAQGFPPEGDQLARYTVACASRPTAAMVPFTTAGAARLEVSVLPGGDLSGARPYAYVVEDA